METVRTKNSSALLIRRIVAIALMALSVGCLFWPSMINLHPDLQEKLEEKLPSDREARDSFEKEAERLLDDLDELRDRFQYYTGKTLPKAPFSKGDIRNDATRIYRDLKDGALTLAELRSTVSIAARYFGKGSDYINDVIDRADREILDSARYDSYTKREYETQYRSAVADAQKKLKEYTSIVKTSSIVVNVLFFATLGFGVLGILLMCLNLVNLNPLHTVFAFLLAGGFLVLFFVGNSKIPDALGSDYSDLPDKILKLGASTILMPLLSLAACIVYKRDRRTPETNPVNPVRDAGSPRMAGTQYNGPRQNEPWSNPQRQYTAQRQNESWSNPQRQSAAAYGSQPQQTAPRTVDGSWTCPVCEAQNPAGAQFCALCGNPRSAAPAKRNEVTFCTSCGNKIGVDLSFCPYCGAKQR